MKRLIALFPAVLWLLLSCPLHPQEAGPRELFSRAYALFSQGNLSEAEEIFRKTLHGKFSLEDYSLYFLGLISFHRADMASARIYLDQLRERFPQSVWSSRAELHLAKISLAESNYQQAAGELRALRARQLKKEIADEALYLLGQVHKATGEIKKAYSLYQELRRASPLSPWAAKARREVVALREQNPQLFDLTTADALSEEGELLLQEREYREAERVYRKLLDLASEETLRPRFLMGLANVYRGARKREEALPILAEIVRQYPESPEAPTALYRLAQTYWSRDENLKALDHFKQLKERYPRSAFIDSAEFAAARIYESLGRVEDALGIYRDFARRLSQSRLREEAQWRLAWVHYLQADYGRAYKEFQALAGDKKAELYQTAALYWQARAADKMGRSEEAKQIFLKIVNGQQESYYAGPASRWLEKMGVTVEEREAARSAPSPEEPPFLSPADSFHLARARELAEISLSPLAVGELDEIKNLSSGESPVRLILIREYDRNMAYDRSVRLANQLPQSWNSLDRYRYPLAYWEPIRKKAEEKGLDPYLVLALIRQESLFDPKALSPASAFGLMQLLPTTAVRTAAQLGLPSPLPPKLFEPELNLTLGTHYLKELLQRYSNNLVKAIAAYNAGEEAVARWEKQIPAEDEEEFIERIPYRETRLYVKLILRNHRIYRKLYDKPK